MTYPEGDPRGALGAPVATAGDPASRPAGHHEASALRSGFVRGQNCAVSWTDTSAGDIFECDAVDEHFILLPDESTRLTVRTAGGAWTVGEPAVIVMPAGSHRIEVHAPGPVIHVLTTRDERIADRAVNADVYIQPDPLCTPLGPPRVVATAPRVHLLRDNPVTPGLFGRIFRTADLMVNLLADEDAPRDPSRLSPHHHDDFEQLSLAVEGTFVHHIRYPWTPDSTTWREDEHRVVESPSLTVIPPPAVHTTQGIGPRQRLIDIFSPVREDFLAQSGWVRNAEDYS